MFCGKCGVNLPEGSQFCLKCGQAVPPPPAPTITADASRCGKCGVNLPEGSQFCLKCGQAVQASAANPTTQNPAPFLSCAMCGAKFPARAQFCPMCGQSVNAMASAAGVSPEPPVPASREGLPRRRKPQVTLWLLLIALALVIFWAATGDNPLAQQVRRLASKSHTETVAPAVFSVKPHGFASYPFTVPSGSVDVVVSGEFTATGDSSSEIEVYVFKDDAFVNWQYGSSPSAYYSSGRVIKGNINAELPAGAGTYDVVFNNNFSPRTTKSVQSVVTLHYDKFWPQI